jgi:hypothetical protein
MVHSVYFLKKFEVKRDYFISVASQVCYEAKFAIAKSPFS